MAAVGVSNNYNLHTLCNTFKHGGNPTVSATTSPSSPSLRQRTLNNISWECWMDTLNPHSLLPALKLCGKDGASVQGKQLHSFAIKSGLISDAYVQNAMITMYFRCGMTDEARLVFNKMPNRTGVSWNTVIAGFADLSDWETVKYLFWLMIEEFNTLPSSFSVVRMISACCRSEDVEMGKRVHGWIDRNGVGFCLNVCNALMNMYAKFGNMEMAHELFCQMPDRDVVSWTTLVSGYAGQRYLLAARDIFDKMPDRNVVAWNAMIAGYAVNSEFNKALLLFQEMMVIGIKPDKATLISLLSACSHLGNLKIGRFFHGYIYKINIDMTIELMNALVTMYVKSSNLCSAELLFKRISNRNEITSTLMMEAFVKKENPEAALAIFSQMPFRDLASWNSLITVLARSGYYNEACNVFYEMQRLNVRPNALTLVSMLSVCAKTGVLALGKWIHSYIERNGIELHTQLGSALVDMYIKCGCVDCSLKIFDKMTDKDLSAWSTMIGGLAMHGRAQHSLKLFKQMEQDGMHPDGIVFLGILSACCHGGLVEEGFGYFDLMTRKYGISPSAEHCSCMVNLFARQGRLTDAYHFLTSSIASSAAETSWRALLSACATYENIELAEYVTSRLIEMDPRSSEAYILLSNAYAKVSKWDDVRNVRNMMRRKGIQKVPGFSSVEVNGVVHEFFAGYAYHPSCGEIYNTLDHLEKQMKTS